MLLTTLRVAAASPKVPTKRPPAVPAGARFSTTVLLITSVTPSVKNPAPPCHAVDTFPLNVLLTMVAFPSDRRPPATSACAMLPLTVLRVMLIVLPKKP